MSSKRKRKKAEAKANAKAEVNGDNKKTMASVAEAITKANGKKQAEPVKKPDAKVITGFGRKIEGAVIHALTDLHGSALCDYRITGIEIKDYLIPKDVTCAKCQRYVVFKQLLAAPVVQKPTKKKDVKTRKSTEKSVSKPKQEKEPQKDSEKLPDDSAEIIEGLKGLLDFKLQKMEKRLVKKLEKYCETLLDARPRFFVVRKANNMYQIVHDPSRYVICDNVKESLAEELLSQYLAIEHTWDGQSKPSPKWLSAIRKINEERFPKTKKEEKRTLKRRKPKPSIKKRKDAKPERRIIRRRSKN